jgi:hypothetical protein
VTTIDLETGLCTWLLKKSGALSQRTYSPLKAQIFVNYPDSDRDLVSDPFDFVVD